MSHNEEVRLSHNPLSSLSWAAKYFARMLASPTSRAKLLTFGQNSENTLLITVI
jgi:hypothetical protein